MNKIFSLVNKYNIAIVLCLFLEGCNKRIPQVTYIDRTVTYYDTTYLKSEKNDSIPCDDFKYTLVNNTDTVYVQVDKKIMTVKTIIRHDTTYRDVRIILPAPLKQINKTKIDNSVDNSIKNKAKNNSAIGDGNAITTNKVKWWWIFIAGVMSWFIFQNVILRWLKSYFPFLKILF